MYSSFLRTALLLLCAMAASVGPSAAATASTALVIGEVSDEPAKKIRRMQPLADYLAAHLREFGVSSGEVQIAPDLSTMGRWMRGGQVHLYFDSPYPAMIVINESGARPILRRWKEGVSEYHSVIFARADSGVFFLRALKGRMLGLEKDYSTTGYFLPLVQLIKAGLQPMPKPRPDSEVPRDEVGFVFTADDRNTIQWVLSGKVAAGAVDSSAFAKIPAETRRALVVLGESPTVVRHIVMARPVMPPRLRDAIKVRLLAMHQSPEGQSVLRVYEETSRFDEFPLDAEMSRVREMYRLIKSR